MHGVAGLQSRPIRPHDRATVERMALMVQERIALVAREQVALVARERMVLLAREQMALVVQERRYRNVAGRTTTASAGSSNVSGRTHARGRCRRQGRGGPCSRGRSKAAPIAHVAALSTPTIPTALVAITPRRAAQSSPKARSSQKSSRPLSSALCLSLTSTQMGAPPLRQCQVVLNHLKATDSQPSSSLPLPVPT